MNIKPKPTWLRKKLPSGPEFGEVSSLLAEQGLHTVCREARCPNQGECFSRRTATFMIMGSRCTRNCRFCAVDHGPKMLPDPNEAKRVALAAKELGLNYVVVTSVTRDDLPDGGAGCFAAVIRELRAEIEGVKVEVLVPDFQGDPAALAAVVRASPQVLNHNLETVPRLYPQARPQADYGRSLELLARAGQLDGRMHTKSGLMLGLGETKAEIKKALADLLEAGCTVLTLGQYLQPSQNHLPVARYLPPDEFDSLRETALAMGFAHVVSGPFVRSSYKAEALFDQKAPDAC
ncbi:MAG: lipoyl synthase [Thermodesulfobacteriota bacterium]